MYKVGLDVGSTTAKIVALDDQDDIFFSKYIRHNADIKNTVLWLLKELKDKLPQNDICFSITGSVGMGIAKQFDIPFIQEVIAVTKFVQKTYPEISTIIDIGGEDAKIVFIDADGSVDLRMNSNCAGGTGAFLDQMAGLIGISVTEINEYASKSAHIYPIASRCGVFSKTDIQNLISKNVSKEDIAASVLQAVTVQTVVTLSQGCKINPKIFMCGGPLTFMPELRNTFIKYLNLENDDILTLENANIITAYGTAMSCENNSIELTKLIFDIENQKNKAEVLSGLDPIFLNEKDYDKWKSEKNKNKILNSELKTHKGFSFLGIDSGSTTTKLVLTDEQDRILFSSYKPNKGNPIATVKEMLVELEQLCKEYKIELKIKGSCSTGYGEDLIKAAFNLDNGIIETIAHYLSAKKINPKVTFILDVGGQDMKAMFIDKGILTRIEINEACSSGCGSFIESLAKSLNYNITDFTKAACFSKNPSELGTRCTVFMNSKIKQALGEGAKLEDIAAGLSYSVVKNCLYKVLKLRQESELGKHIVVQGGTMLNDSIVRALEKCIGTKVYRSEHPELMGSYGCALYAHTKAENDKVTTISDILSLMDYKTSQMECKGCENQCFIYNYKFLNGKNYYSGNKCEKVFTNKGNTDDNGANSYIDKYNLLFNRKNIVKEGLSIGIPRVLNMFEEYPFWHTIFEECGIKVILSDSSTFSNYEKGVHSVMSDNICFPAKLVHSHIYNLIEKKPDIIFMPYTVYEKTDGKKEANSYNCPIVSGYSDVIKSVIEQDIPIDTPIINFKDKKLLFECCKKYLLNLGISSSVIRKAFKNACSSQEIYESTIKELNQKIYLNSMSDNKTTILLAGRPYHTDPLVQHKISDVISSMGVNVITEDIVRNDDRLNISENNLVKQWSYINRILKAAIWVSEQNNNIHFVQMTSFGCGPDAFLLDEVREILSRNGKTLTILKIDDINNVGSLKLRVRSLIESLKFSKNKKTQKIKFLTTKTFTASDSNRTIIAPFISEYITPVLRSVATLGGCNMEILPESDKVSVKYGLQYANNEVCYPATLIVGDVIKALKSRKYDLKNTSVAITQTCGQCRATNYISLIKKAMVDSGFEDIPVIALGKIANKQSGLKIDWLKILPVAIRGLLYSDSISKFYHASVIREKKKGDAIKLRDKYLKELEVLVLNNDMQGLLESLSKAAIDFNSIITEKQTSKVGLVGEIFVKFNSYANKNISKSLISNGAEVVPPSFMEFFTQGFVNNSFNNDNYLQKKYIPNFLSHFIYSLIYKEKKKVNNIGKEFKHFTPFKNIFSEAANGAEIINLAAQFGEGWFLPAEMVSFAKNDINNIVSVQPFGCIANHIISKGVQKKIKNLYPKINLLSLDYDSGVSDVNIENRLLLFMNNLK